ncbi:hypothetical protein [Streptomyces boninensis]|uniref:hypothetical protein n=1 Tax=Streptomyces boninensis TaxID=2039455 RepID=UPI003B21F7DA
MADAKSNAPKGASAEFPQGGLHHVRVPLTKNFTVLSNDLLQRTESALTLGIGAYILSLPEGAPISIKALCKKFREGEIRIARALRELQDAGWIERRLERADRGRVVTRTLAYTQAGATVVQDTAVPEIRELPGRPDNAAPSGVPVATRAPALPPAAAAAAAEEQPQAPAQHKPAQPAPLAISTQPPDPRSLAILAGLRERDPRLHFSEAETPLLAHAVTEWLKRDTEPRTIIQALTDDLPQHLRSRPARIIAHRLAAHLPPEPVPPSATVTPPLRLQECPGCDSPFRAREPGRCRECREQDASEASGRAA